MKEVTRIEKRLSVSGWRLKPNGKNHHVWLCPCGGHRVTIAGTPSDGRAMKNLKADIRRCPAGGDAR